ncbi:P-loop containing nucleoside triphosphate hydrolase protein [Geopyxis carbonaria]|nr:P-loop containing nucleoside triphosphate hydrolase protein [Geopyxis carbonaria]
MLKDPHVPGDADLGALKAAFSKFKKEVQSQLAIGTGSYTPSGATAPSVQRLRHVFARKGTAGLITYLRFAFFEHMGYKQPVAIEQQFDRYESAADTRFPQEWYVGTRQVQREWHLHVGPTNSGKTYHALKRLEESGNGIYAGPLRLLAHEIYERMNAKGIQCNLITGDDVRRVSENATMTSSTMEMVDLNREVDVCVIDEIQMIGDPDRGWAWTQALLGVRAKEVHLCGEERTVHLIRQLAASVGDKLIIHWYNRLGPLEVMPESLDGDLKKLEDGDCVVTFSRKNIFALKRSIEEATGKRCAVVYGSLPPETRSAQAQLFNDQDSEYKILVASDAVGMGLNLSIKRVIFEATEKWNGTSTVAIEVPQVKQIAGRAGRYKVHNKNDAVQKEETLVPLPAAPQPGYVTTLEKYDHKTLATAMATNVHQIKTAGILPLPQHVVHFASQFKASVPFSTILRRLEEFMATSTLFHPCSLRENILYAELIDSVKALTVEERLTFIAAPLGNTIEAKNAFRKMAECVADGLDGSLLRIPGIDLEILDQTPTTISDLKRFESLHKVLILYLWLSFRFPTTFTPRETAMELKALCEKKIETCLQTIKFTLKPRKPAGRKTTAVTPAETAPADADAVDAILAAAAAEAPGPEEKVAYDYDAPVYVSPRSMVCSHCGERGHQKGFCPQLPRMACYVCGQPGHMSKMCPMRDVKGFRRGSLKPKTRGPAILRSAAGQRGAVMTPAAGGMNRAQRRAKEMEAGKARGKK